MSSRWLTAEQATAALSVSRQTLYAYVSRGRIGVTAAPEEPRRSLYDAADVHRLAERKRSGRPLETDHSLTRFTMHELFADRLVRGRLIIVCLMSLATTLAWWGISSWVPRKAYR